MKSNKFKYLLIVFVAFMYSSQIQAQTTQYDLDVLRSKELIENKKLYDFLVEHEKGNQLAIIDAMVRFYLSQSQQKKLSTAENSQCHKFIYRYMLEPETVVKHTIDAIEKEDSFGTVRYFLDDFVVFLNTDNGKSFINQQQPVMSTWLVANEDGKFVVNPLAKKFTVDFPTYGFISLDSKYLKIRNDFDWPKLYEVWYARLNSQECRNVFN
jgi:frataxin-like iron-binding protein CyaY